MLLGEDVAAAFLRETGLELRVRKLMGRSLLMPVDDRLGSFGILIGQTEPDFDESTHLRFPSREYPQDVHLVWWGNARVDEIDVVLRRITGAPSV